MAADQGAASRFWSESCRYFLARPTVGMQVEIVDGCHGDPEGVVKAARTHEAIFGKAGPWLMVEFHELPEIAVEINEDAADVCRDLVQGRLA